MSAQIQSALDRLTIIRRNQVEARTGLSRSSIYAAIAAGNFPAPVPLLNGKSVGWVESEISAWIESRIAARNAQRG